MVGCERAHVHERPSTVGKRTRSVMPVAERIPIACTLTTKEAASQLDEWAAVRAAATSTRPVDGGHEVTLPADLHETVRDLAAREAACCAFLTLDVAADDSATVLRITGPADAAPVIDLIVGRA